MTARSITYPVGVPPSSAKPREPDVETDGRRRRGIATRAAALRAASELFSTQGYAASSISSIAKAADVQPASLYHLFGSKEGILAAVVEEASNEYFEQLDLLDADLPPAELVYRLGETFESHPLFLRLLLILVLERGTEDPELLEIAIAVRTRARRLIAQAIREHLSSLPEARLTETLDDIGRFLLAMIDGAFIARHVDSDPVQARRVFRMMGEAIESALQRLSTSD